MPLLADLEAALSAKGQALIAFSGGVDSGTLAAVAHRVLGADAMAVTFDTETVPRRDVQAARRVAGEIGLRHRVVAYREIADPAYRANAPDRCYHCRVQLGDQLARVAEEEGFDVLAAGILPADLDDHAPGVAALEEAGVWFPFVDVGADKPAIRDLARRLGLSIHDKPTESCLSSRIPYGDEVTEDKLETIAAAEEALHDLGFEGVRVRHHGELARIEVPPDEREALLSQAEEVTRRLREAGYTWVSMDLLGYRTGTMNEALPMVNGP